MAVTWIDKGMVKRIQGVTFSTRVSVEFENAIIHAASGIFNRPLPDCTVLLITNQVHVFEKTMAGCFISADNAVSYGRAEETSEFADDEKKDLMPPVDIGEQIASLLPEEIERGEVIDSTHQGLLFLLCALCHQDVSKVRVGKLSKYGNETLRNIRDFLDLKFVIKPNPNTGTVILKCIGSGLKNLSRKVS